MSNVSAAHVSATLAKAGHPRATEPNQTDSGYGESGFVVQIEAASWAGGRLVTVRYGDYDHEGDYSNHTGEIVREICEEAFDGYTGTLQACGYTVEKWMKYDGTQLGLFVIGREG